MNKRKGFILAAVLVLFTCSAAMALSYAWLGTGSDALWTTAGNWVTSYTCSPCYPTTGDDATISMTDTVEMVDGVTMDDLTVSVDDDEITVTFDDGDDDSENPTTLTADVFLISGVNGAEEHVATVVFTNGARIKN